MYGVGRNQWNGGGGNDWGEDVVDLDFGVPNRGTKAPVGRRVKVLPKIPEERPCL